MVLRHEQAPEFPRWLVTAQTAAPTPRIHNSARLGRFPRIWVSDMFPGDADAAGLGDHTFRTTEPTPVKFTAPSRVSPVRSEPHRPTSPAHQVGGRSFFFTPK